MENTKQEPDTTPSKKKVSDAKKPATQKKKVPKLLVWLLIAAVVVALFWFLFLRDSGTSGTIGDSKLNNIQTYLSKSSSDTDKTAQSSFVKGDPIQVGFTYDTSDEDDFVRFVVTQKESGEEAFATNLFKLNPEETELFVSINNTSLDPGIYEVELQDKDANVTASVEYSITE